MRRSLIDFTPFVLCASLAFVGCDGKGPQPEANPGAKTTATATAPDQPASGQAREVTPNRVVDPKSLVDVVEAEVKGGEVSKGNSTPESSLWQPADESAIRDEPMTVPVPLGLPALIENVQVPGYNPMTRGRVELGKMLYFDPRVSKDGTVSCATCHNPEKGWTDRLPHSIGIKGQVGSRNAPTVLNTVYGRTMFWDGRAPSLEGQAQGPIQNKIEMGDQSYEEIIERLRAISGYREQFRRVFGTDVTLDGLAKAVAAFERTVLSGHSAYDRYLGGPGIDPDPKALTDSQKRGMVLFGLDLHQDDTFKTEVVKKKANCTSCHIGFNFTDEQFHNLGVGWDERKGTFDSNDFGRFAVAPVGAKTNSEIGAFKTPTLRDVERTAPYMHDGTEATLEAVVDFYDRGGNPNPHLDQDMKKKLDLTPQEKADLVTFLKALTGDEVRVALPTLPTGPDGKAPDARAALEPPPPTKTARDVHPPVLR